MGEGTKPLWEPTFNRAVKVRGGQDRLTSDAGVLLLREADHRLGLIESLAQQLYDPRNPDKIRYTLVELLRERVYALAQGYETQDDLDRLAHDPAMKMAVWDRPGEQVLEERLGSQPTQSRLIDTLASHKGNLEATREALADWCARHLRATGSDHAARHITIDIDSFPIEVHGLQAGGAYNGYYRDTVYHPLVASYSVEGDYDSFQDGQRLGQGFLHVVLRAGNVHTANGAARFFREVLRKSKQLGYVPEMRFDAGLAEGKLLDLLSDENVRYVGRLKGNPRLDALAAPHLTRPVGRPPKEGYESIVELGPHRAESWRHSHRLILVVTDQPDPKSGQLNLLPDYFFLVTNHPVERVPGENILAKYRGRGTFEDRLGEFRGVIDPKLSSPSFAENEALLLVTLLAFNLANMLRCELESSAGSCWDLGRFQKSVLKAGGRVVKHSGKLLLDLAQAVIPLWQRLITCLQRWRFPGTLPAPRGPRARAYMPPPAHAFLAEVLRE
jgi:hypothetical protein